MQQAMTKRNAVVKKLSSMKPLSRLVFVLLLAACSPLRGCVESQFTLSPDSRIPKWFSLPAGYSRDDVTVKLTYYTPSVNVDNAVLELLDKKGTTLSKVAGESCWHPIMEKKKNKYGGFDADSYPHYGYIRANGIVEVVEHIQGPTFRVSDDPILLKGALESKRCDKG